MIKRKSKEILFVFLFVISVIIISSDKFTLEVTRQAYAAEVFKSGDYEYGILEDGTVDIYQYTGKATKVKFPSTLAGRKVTRISRWGDGVFVGDHNEKVLSVVVPEGVTVIDGSFWECVNMKSITLPESLLTIVRDSFSGCRALTEIKLPTKLEFIGAGTFVWCDGLKEIIIPDSVVIMEKGAISRCSNLKKIKLSKNAPTFTAAYLDSLKDISIPEGVEKVSLDKCKALEKISLPSSLKDLTIMVNDKLESCNIPEGVTQLDLFLGYCTKLKSVKLPTTLENISDSAFRGCKNLENVNIPSNVKSVGMNILYDTDWYKKQKDGLVYKDKWCIGYKGETKKVKSLSVANGTKGIANYLCDSVDSGWGENPNRFKELKSVTLPESVEIIGNRAFADCSKLDTFTLPKSIQRIENDAFKDTAWMKKQKKGVLYKDGWIIGYKGTMKDKFSLNIVEGTVGISDNAFENKKELTKVTFPDTVRYIGEYSFSRNGLKSVTLPKNVKWFNYAFSGCSELNELYIPEGINRISDYAFSSCNNLKYVNLPSSLKEIGEGAFYLCENLDDIVLPEGLEKISSLAFCYCDSLRNIVLPSSMTSISEEAFYNSALISIVILSRDVEIGQYALGYESRWLRERWIFIKEHKFDTTKIIGYSNSTAEVYARKNKFNFVDITEEGLELPE